MAFSDESGWGASWRSYRAGAVRAGHRLSGPVPHTLARHPGSSHSNTYFTSTCTVRVPVPVFKA